MSTDRTAEMLNYLSAISREVGEFRREFNEHRAETTARLERIEREQREQRRFLDRLVSAMLSMRADTEELQDRVAVLEQKQA